MGRYDLPDPKCNHRIKQNMVTSGDMKTGPHASTLVCDREACIQDAKEWCFASTHLPAAVHALPAPRRM